MKSATDRIYSAPKEYGGVQALNRGRARTVVPHELLQILRALHPEGIPPEDLRARRQLYPRQHSPQSASSARRRQSTPRGLNTDTVELTMKTLSSHRITPIGITLENSILPPMLYGSHMPLSSAKAQRTAA
eukprot:422896-Prorocentrum_minimum.AAC.1